MRNQGLESLGSCSPGPRGGRSSFRLGLLDSWTSEMDVTVTRTLRNLHTGCSNYHRSWPRTSSLSMLSHPSLFLPAQARALKAEGQQPSLLSVLEHTRLKLLKKHTRLRHLSLLAGLSQAPETAQGWHHWALSTYTAAPPAGIRYLKSSESNPNPRQKSRGLRTP